jgi:DNA (cytosine-5)-methyltransferase 1
MSALLPEWMMGLKRGHITDVPGLSWKDQVKAAGNGVCPQQAALAFRHLLKVAAL